MTLRQEPQGSFSFGPKPTRPLWWHSIYQPQCQLDQSYNDDCAEDNELSENKLWSVGRANFDYYAPRAYRNVYEVLFADCALARWRAGVLLRRGGEIAVSHDDPTSEARSVTSRRKCSSGTCGDCVIWLTEPGEAGDCGTGALCRFMAKCP